MAFAFVEQRRKRCFWIRSILLSAKAVFRQLLRQCWQCWETVSAGSHQGGAADGAASEGEPGGLEGFWVGDFIVGTMVFGIVLLGCSAVPGQVGR